MKSIFLTNVLVQVDCHVKDLSSASWMRQSKTEWAYGDAVGKRKRHFLLISSLLPKISITRFSPQHPLDRLCETCSRRNPLILLSASGFEGEIKSVLKRGVHSRDQEKFTRAFFVKCSYLTEAITHKIVDYLKKFGRFCRDVHKRVSLPKQTDNISLPVIIKCVIRLSSSQQNTGINDMSHFQPGPW